MTLFEFNKEKKKELVELVSRRIFDSYSLKNEPDLDQTLEEMIYWEKKRSKKYKYWDQYKEQYLQSSLETKKELLKGSIDHYSHQIVGNFNPTIYHLSAKLIPPFLNLLLDALSLKRLWHFRASIVNENIMMTGNLPFIRSLATRGTLVFVPTHLSNLDSILMGTALYYADLPPVMYGAGLNLFKNKIIGFFMNNLGAYKVDRLRIHQLYKDVLKEYAASSIQLGFHNLFFPGGTRSRSGSVEKKLKLGLLGTSLKAYIRNLEESKLTPNIYIIPVNLNAHLTLEAETLIGDFLAATGQSRYIIENDEFSKLGRLYSYFKNLMHLNSKTFVHFGDPLDPFGNKVNSDGKSIDYHGRVIDISRYVKREGVIVHDDDRDQNYTKELAKMLMDVFHCNNRVLSTNLVAFTLYEMIANRYPDFDIYKLLRTYTYHKAIPLKDVYEKLERVRQFLEQLSDQGRIIYAHYLKKLDAQDIVNEALKIFASYHQRRTVYRVGDELWVGDLLLLYYYHNRLVGYNLEDMLKGTL